MPEYTLYFSKITFFSYIISDGETKPQDFSPSDNNLSVSELKLQDGDQLIAVNKLQKYVFLCHSNTPRL